MFARVFVLDDVMYELVQLVPPWLARWSLAEGWIGFAREELSLNVWLSFYAVQGYAYVTAPGEEPQPLSAGTPAFTARQTTEPWARGPTCRSVANSPRSGNRDAARLPGTVCAGGGLDGPDDGCEPAKLW